MNAVPPGEVTTAGEFGPWNEDELGATPVSGDYTFAQADLSHFKGISGTLSSVGSYKGTLGRLDVEGTTQTPDFTVGVAGNPVNLVTEFHAIVDGTDGDTRLVPVRAMVGETEILAEGGVIGHPGEQGKTVDLQVSVKGGRLEDILPLGVKGHTSPMKGSLGFEARLIIPPENVDVIDKISIDGQFEINGASFTQPQIQEKVDELSRRASGRSEKDATRSNVLSGLNGNFTLGKGIMSISDLSFAIPGASVHLNGQYGLQDDRLDFKGRLLLKAKLSQTTTGIKSLLLKIVDPFFRDDGITNLPIKITGSREKPSFGLNF
jgi:hypothetical protein